MLKLSQRDETFDINGGIVLSEPEQLNNAKKAVLITMPKDTTGTNCGNCKFFSNQFCNHQLMKLAVNERQCCNYWDKEGTYFAGSSNTMETNNA